MRTHRWIFWHCLRAASLSYLFKDSGIDRSRYWARIRSRDVRPNWMPHVWKGAFHVYRTRGELLLRCRNRNIMKWNVWWRGFFCQQCIWAGLHFFMCLISDTRQTNANKFRWQRWFIRYESHTFAGKFSQVPQFDVIHDKIHIKPAFPETLMLRLKNSFPAFFS